MGGRLSWGLSRGSVALTFFLLQSLCFRKTVQGLQRFWAALVYLNHRLENLNLQKVGQDPFCWLEGDFASCIILRHQAGSTPWRTTCFVRRRVALPWNRGFDMLLMCRCGKEASTENECTRQQPASETGRQSLRCWSGKLASAKRRPRFAMSAGGGSCTLQGCIFESRHHHPHTFIRIAEGIFLNTVAHHKHKKDKFLPRSTALA